MNKSAGMAQVVVAVLILAVMTGACLPLWTMASQDFAVSGMWAMLVTVILLVLILAVKGAFNGRH